VGISGITTIGGIFISLLLHKKNTIDFGELGTIPRQL
jgi:hypothetical protein